MRLFELARLHFDREQYEVSLPYFARGIPKVKKIGTGTSDPIAFADVLDQYSVALGKTGKLQESIERKQEADGLRIKNSGKSARFKPVSFPKKCQK
jgi:hypothetical protein